MWISFIIGKWKSSLRNNWKRRRYEEMHWNCSFIVRLWVVAETHQRLASQLSIGSFIPHHVGCNLHIDSPCWFGMACERMEAICEAWSCFRYYSFVFECSFICWELSNRRFWGETLFVVGLQTSGRRRYCRLYSRCSFCFPSVLSHVRLEMGPVKWTRGWKSSEQQGNDANC